MMVTSYRINIAECKDPRLKEPILLDKDLEDDQTDFLVPAGQKEKYVELLRGLDAHSLELLEDL